MSELTETAREVATDLVGEGIVVIPRIEANRRIRDRGGFDRLSHREISEGFGAAGWRYGRHLYFHPDEVADRVGAIPEASRASGRLLLTHEEVCDELAPSVTRGVQNGWRRGEFAEIVREAFTDRGWHTDTLEYGSGSRRVYVYPLFDLFREHHPNGRFPFSTTDLFSYYVSTSIERAQAHVALDAGTNGDREVGTPGGATDVEAVDGIGPTYGERLRETGIETVADLAASDPETVAGAAATSVSRARGWIEQVRT